MSEDTAFEVGRLYGPLRAISDTLAASQKDIFVRLPGLVAYYPMGIRGNSWAIEHGGIGYHLFQAGTCPTGYDGNSFVHLGSGVNYLWNDQSAFGITGLETWISSSLRGLTLGGWFMIDSTPTTASGLISKDRPSPDLGYVLNWSTTNTVGFYVSGNGASQFGVVSASLEVGRWHFVTSRFTPSAEVAVFANGDKSTNTTAIPASINVSTQDFEIGRYFNDDNRIIHAKARDVFVCAAALSDQLIEEIRVSSVP